MLVTFEVSKIGRYLKIWGSRVKFWDSEGWQRKSGLGKNKISSNTKPLILPIHLTKLDPDSIFWHSWVVWSSMGLPKKNWSSEPSNIGYRGWFPLKICPSKRERELGFGYLGPIWRPSGGHLGQIFSENRPSYPIFDGSDDQFFLGNPILLHTTQEC